MMDTKEALKELEDLTVNYGNRNEEQIARLDEAIDMAIGALTAQPEKHTEERTETHACDCVSKTSVCEILADIYPTDGEKVVAVKEVDKAYEAIQQMPSAQPEIIYCKDCKYWNDEFAKDKSTCWLPCMSMTTHRKWHCGSAERGTDDGE